MVLKNDNDMKETNMEDPSLNTLVMRSRNLLMEETTEYDTSSDDASLNTVVRRSRNNSRKETSKDDTRVVSSQKDCALPG